MRARSEVELGGCRVLDGGLATELERRGVSLAGPLWSARALRDAPQAVMAVHRDYLEAGADCLMTASYQVSALGYQEALAGEADEEEPGWQADPEAAVEASVPAPFDCAPEEASRAALEASVRLALVARRQYREAGHTRPIVVAASLGPYGAALHNGAEFHGNYGIGFAELVQFHRERIAVLAGTEADLLAFETVPSLEEAQAIAAALRDFPDLAAWISFTCRDRQLVAHGEPLAACAAALEAVDQVVAVGVNCTAPSLITGLLAELGQSTQKPIVVYPNSGEEWDPAARRWTGRSDVAGYGAMAAEWFAAGAQMVGGCCRTGPAHIRAVRAAVGQLTPA